jgi:transglutaminase-like putative cysteine protease
MGAPRSDNDAMQRPQRNCRLARKRTFRRRRAAVRNSKSRGQSSEPSAYIARPGSQYPEGTLPCPPLDTQRKKDLPMAHTQSTSVQSPPRDPGRWPAIDPAQVTRATDASHDRVRIELEIDLTYEIDQFGADFVFNIHAAQTPHQSVSAERLVINQPIAHQVHTDPVTRNRYLRLHGEPGTLEISYSATVDIHHYRVDPTQLAEVPVRHLPQEVMGYIYPSRYCQSDRLLRLATNEFGALSHGHSRAQAICDWVRRHVAFTSNASNSNTAAVDTLVEQVGVCRDFAHLMIALCRAINIPARFTTGTDYGADPALGPPDFHAYVEVYLGDRWYIFDPSGTAIPMGLLRFGVGRDAADVAFATIFGGVSAQPPVIRTTAIQDAARGFDLPSHCAQALSTDHGAAVASGFFAPITHSATAKPAQTPGNPTVA